MKNKNLQDWFNYYRCDKSSSHSYHTVYEPHFDQYKSSFNLLEIGIFKGASGRAFLNCYDNLMYYGIDVFERHDLNTVSDLMSNSRFKVLAVDSTCDIVQDSIKSEWGDVQFDVVIDDGSHLHEDITDTFKNIYPFLKSGGTYYIEDLFPLTFRGLVLDNPQLKNQRDYFLDRPSQFNQKTFSRLIDTIFSFDPTNVEHIDLRVRDNRTDSYVIKITK